MTLRLIYPRTLGYYVAIVKAFQKAVEKWKLIDNNFQNI